MEAICNAQSCVDSTTMMMVMLPFPFLLAFVSLLHFSFNIFRLHFYLLPFVWLVFFFSRALLVITGVLNDCVNQKRFSLSLFFFSFIFFFVGWYWYWCVCVCFFVLQIIFQFCIPLLAGSVYRTFTYHRQKISHTYTHHTKWSHREEDNWHTCEPNDYLFPDLIQSIYDDISTSMAHPHTRTLISWQLFASWNVQK